MKVVRVVAAVICDDIQTKHKIYATARGYGDYKGQWEFPGGKIEPGETAQQALKREIEEELDTEIAVHDKIGTIEYDYPAFHLSMDCFWCEVLSGDLVLKEAEAARWLTKDELDSVQWLPADQTILEKIREMMKYLCCSKLHLQAVPLYIQRLKHAWHCKFAVRILLVGMQSQSL